MLSIGRLGAGQGAYYLGAVARGVEDYYLGAGEAPGEWVGAGAALLGLGGEVDEGRFAELFDLRKAEGGLVATDTARRVPGFDLTFSAPKSVSLVWALGRPETSAEVRRAHEEAVRAALGYLEREAAWVRRGHAGFERGPADGLVAAAFPHRTSRAGDPALHTHVLVANIGRGSDGRWTALDSRALYAHARTAGFLYQVQLRLALTRELGLAFGSVRKGSAEVIGVPSPVLRAFSTRRAQIEEELARAGQSTPAAAEVAALRTRRAKDRAAPPSALRESWRGRAEALGFGTRRVDALLGQRRTLDPDWPAIENALVAPAGVTFAASTFGRREVLRGLSERLAGGAPVEELERRADGLLASGRVVELTKPGASEPRFSTPELLRVERDLVEGARSRRGQGVGVVDASGVVAALASHRELSAEQAAAVTRLLRDGHGVAVMMGGAGAGKTRALAAAGQAWRRSGRVVLGAALAARAAQVLESEAGFPAGTLELVLRDADRHGLPRGSVVVLDEVGMVGTRQLARLARHAARAEAKLVLVGDPRQLAEIEAGGALGGLARRVGAIELLENRRQRAGWEREALDLLREGRAEDSLARYADHGRIHVTETAAGARSRLVADWWEARRSGTDAIMLAARHREVDDLNRRARVLMRSLGFLRGRDLVVADVPLAIGDEVVAMRNRRDLGLLNGTLASVRTVCQGTGEVNVETRDGRRLRVPRSYTADGHLRHGYALTAHKAQGTTATRAYVLGDDGLHLEWGYVALSRGREANHLYLTAANALEVSDLGPVAMDTRGALDHAARGLGRSRAKGFALDAMGP